MVIKVDDFWIVLNQQRSNNNTIGKFHFTQVSCFVLNGSGDIVVKFRHLHGIFIGESGRKTCISTSVITDKFVVVSCILTLEY